ncbi:hypothetical protein FH972_010373 [Carpinus fangiana]|uniref:Uncharacterized protein n=1 Tax=Carpinus fangiana TaxID=176857 RepID=A0A660KQW6_9ROSI|nr:hypothetical protein FH972_010373 [Carpinus fangiana]
MDAAQNPVTSSNERHPRVPTYNAHQILPRATHRPPPTSTIDSGHKVLSSNDPSLDLMTKPHRYYHDDPSSWFLPYSSDDPSLLPKSRDIKRDEMFDKICDKIDKIDLVFKVVNGTLWLAFLGCFRPLPLEDHASPRTPQALVGCDCDYVTEFKVVFSKPKRLS